MISIVFTFMIIQTTLIPIFSVHGFDALNDPGSSRAGLGTIKGRVFDYKGSLLTNQQIRVQKYNSTEEYYGFSNETGNYEINVPAITGLYYVNVEYENKRNESTEYAVIDTIAAGETIEIDLFRIGCLYQPIQMTEGIASTLEITIYDDRMIQTSRSTDYVVMQIALTTPDEYIITESFVQSWIQGNATIREIQLFDETGCFHIARIFAEVPIDYSNTYPTATVDLCPFAVEQAAIQIQTSLFPHESHHIFASIDYNTDQTHGIYVQEANYPPVPCFQFTPKLPLNNELITFNASCSVDPDGSIQHYAWDWNNDTIIDATGQEVSHQWTQPGTYPVTLYVIDNYSATSTHKEMVTIYDDTYYYHITTTIYFNQTISNSIYVGLFDFDQWNKPDEYPIQILSSEQCDSLTFTVPNGSYYLYGFLDENENIYPDEREPAGLAINKTTFEQPTPLLVNGSSINEADITLYNLYLFNVSGSIYYNGPYSGTTYAFAYKEPPVQYVQPIRGVVCEDTKLFTLLLPEDPYYFGSFMDVNDNQVFDIWEPIGFAQNQTYGHLADVLTINDNTSNISITLHVMYDLGDINGDNRLNAADVRYLAMNLNGHPDYSTLYSNADINNDKRMNAADVRYLAMYLNGHPEYDPLYP